MVEFETIVNPPQEVWEQLVKYSGESEDWAFQLDDYKFWSENYDQFWLVTVVEKGTLNLVASVTLARLDGSDGPLFNVGMFYCVKKYRGKGIAKPIFKYVMDIVGGNNAALTGTANMFEKYVKDFGFDKYPDHWHLYSCLKIADIVIPEKVSDKYTTKNWVDVDSVALTAYDRTICIRDRSNHMIAWFKMKNTFTRVIVDESGRIVGYGTIRLVTLNKLSIAPFYADNIEAAEVLLKDLLQNVPNWKQYSKFGFLYPETNKDPLILLQKVAKSKECVSTCRYCRSQFTKDIIPTPDQKIYAMLDCAHQYV